MSHNPQPAHDLASAAHPDTAGRDQVIVIAHIARGRAALKYGAGFLFFCLALWVSLRPPWDAHRVSGIVCVVIALLMIVATFTMWFSRGRRTAITLKGGKLYLPTSEFALDDVIQVQSALWQNPEVNVLPTKYIEIQKRGGDAAMVPYTDLREDGDVVITRLNDALARHRAAAPAPVPDPAP